MSQETREWVAFHPHIVYQKVSQKSDLLNPNLTKTELLASLQHLLQQGWIICITACVSDHGPDGSLCVSGPPYCGTHQYGWAIDCWPMNSLKINDYISSSDVHFQKFLSQCAQLQYLHQIGLGGDADQPINQTAAGPTWFPDSTAPHIHIGCKV